MKINIIQTQPDQTQPEIQISFANEKLIVGQKSDDWNNKGINNFLLKLASITPHNEEIIVESVTLKENEESPLYKHIKDLFETFSNEYNSRLVKNNISEEQ